MTETIQIPFSAEFYLNLFQGTGMECAEVKNNKVTLKSEHTSVLKTDQALKDLHRTHWRFLGETFSTSPVEDEESDAPYQEMMKASGTINLTLEEAKALFVAATSDGNGKPYQGGFLRREDALKLFFILPTGMPPLIHGEISYEVDRQQDAAGPFFSIKTAYDLNSSEDDAVLGKYEQEVHLRQVKEGFELTFVRNSFLLDRNYFENQILPGAKNMLAEAKSFDSKNEMLTFVPCLVDVEFAQLFFEKLAQESVAMQEEVMKSVERCFGEDVPLEVRFFKSKLDLNVVLNRLLKDMVSKGLQEEKLSTGSSRVADDDALRLAAEIHQKLDGAMQKDLSPELAAIVQKSAITDALPAKEQWAFLYESSKEMLHYLNEGKFRDSMKPLLSEVMEMQKQGIESPDKFNMQAYQAKLLEVKAKHPTLKKLIGCMTMFAGAMLMIGSTAALVASAGVVSPIAGAGLAVGALLIASGAGMVYQHSKRSPKHKFWKKPDDLPSKEKKSKLRQGGPRSA